MLRYGLNKSQSTFKCRRYITQRNRELEREQQSNGLRRSAVAGGATDTQGLEERPPPWKPRPLRHAPFGQGGAARTA